MLRLTSALTGFPLVGASSFSRAVTLLALVAAPALAWDAVSPHEEKTNTHLFIVDRALDLLRGGDETARRAAAELEACRASWEDGLAAADAQDAFVDAQHLGAHFYDPRETDGCHTFRFFGCRQAAGNARANAQLQLTHVREGHSAVAPGAYGFHQASRCFALGLALHFMTDVTGPFHAQHFSGAQAPMMLHPTFEADVPRFQHRFVEARWAAPPWWMTPDDVLVAAADEARALSGELLTALKQARGLCVYSPTPGTVYVGPCFRDDARAQAATGAALKAAQRHTADWLYALFRQQPKLHLTP